MSELNCKTLSWYWRIRELVVGWKEKPIHLMSGCFEYKWILLSDTFVRRYTGWNIVNLGWRWKNWHHRGEKENSFPGSLVLFLSSQGQVICFFYWLNWRQGLWSGESDGGKWKWPWIIKRQWASLPNINGWRFSTCQYCVKHFFGLEPSLDLILAFLQES